ncbi:metallophosphoesterase [Roseomonas sp. OT10]|uniref:metallophosphoesterase family protein n=1 Tax=Roseomonas cutis TaxID=2897332 RepID=UPI001E383E04|nr:metallophosphoesterase [Roseomonas sp. OT10]UFN48684.1 metallophosphoesterase [Roseomonas sp. OT10]
MAGPFRLIQVSDTHLSPRHAGFNANFDVVATRLRDARPDLVVHTGDVSAHGERGEDLDFARARMDGLGLDWLAVPGNHDVGDDPAIAVRDPAESAQVTRWRSAFGPDLFVRDVPGWRLVGLDSLISGAAAPEAEAQFATLADALAGAGDRALALFLHKPLCYRSLDEVPANPWSVPPAPRRRILELLRGHPPAFVASGHVHQWWDRGVFDGLRQIWAPATAFLVGDPWQQRVGDKVLGYVEHDLHPDGRHECRLVQPAGLAAHDLGLMPEVYGPQAHYGLEAG